MTRRQRSGRATLAALLASSAFLACETNLTQLTEAVGPIAYNFAVGPSAASLPSGTVAVGGGAVTLTLTGLRALAAGQYQFWVLGRDPTNLDVPVQAFGSITEFFRRVDTLPGGTPNLDPVTGDTIYVTDSRVISAVQVAGYAGSDDPMGTTAVVTVDSVADGTDPTTYHAVFVTLETSAAATPGPAQFLWRRIGVGGAGAMLFGNFGGSDVIATQSPRDYVFGPRGAGAGGARGPELSVDFRELSRPPVGFVYRGYVVNTLGDGVLVDELRSAWSTDSTVSRVSLSDADVNDALPGVVGGEIRTAQVRNCASASATINCQNSMDLPVDSTFAGYANFQLKLEPKDGVAPIRNKSVSLAGALPSKVQ